MAEVKIVCLCCDNFVVDGEIPNSSLSITETSAISFNKKGGSAEDCLPIIQALVEHHAASGDQSAGFGCDTFGSLVHLSGLKKPQLFDVGVHGNTARFSPCGGLTERDTRLIESNGLQSVFDQTLY